MIWDWWTVTDGKNAIPVRSLTGDLPSHGGRTLVDVFLVKRKLRNQFWKKGHG